ADGEVRNLPGFVATVAPSQVGEIGVGIRSHVLDPVHHFLWRSTAGVAVDVSIRAEHVAQIEKLVRAKRIRVDAAPTAVWPSRAFVAWSDAVAPVILVGEAATGPAQNRNVKFLQRHYCIGTQATR